MGKDTSIQWTDGTVNPTMGCDGCELWNGRRGSCYAALLTKRFGKANPLQSKYYQPLSDHELQQLADDIK